MIGGTVDIVESEPENEHGVELLDPNNSIRVPREKMVYMAVNDSQQEEEELSKYMVFLWEKICSWAFPLSLSNGQYLKDVASF